MARLPKIILVRILLLAIVCSCFRSVQNHPEEERVRVTHSQDDRGICASKDQDCRDRDFEGFQSEERLVRLEGFKVGYVQDINIVDGQTHKLITRSMRPLMFEIANFLNDDECDHIIELAKKEGLTESKTLDTGVDNDSSANANTAEKVDENQELMKQCKEIIGDYDLDKNGQLSGAELAPYLENVTSLLLKEKEIETMLEELKFDENGDGLLTYEECLKVNVSALEGYLDNLEDNHPSYRSRTSQQAWLSVHENSDSVLLSLRNRVKKLTKLPNGIIDQSEHLQVVRYTVGGHFHAHYDSTDKEDKSCCRYLHNNDVTATCNLCRFMTILYYLNNVTSGGETAFPVADNKTYDEDEYERRGLSNLSTRCYQSNVFVSPRKGTAILWYNHDIDPATGRLGPMDKFSLHGGCDVLEGVKWIANNWINDFR